MMLRALSAIALVLAAPAHAELTDFDTQYDYLTTVVRADLSVLTQVVHLQVNSNLTAALLPLLDETEAQIGAGNLTFPIYFTLRDGLFDVANATLSGDDVAKFVAEIDTANEAVDATDMIRVAPLAFGDVTFDLLDAMAKEADADDFAKTFVDERDAYEKLVHVGIGADRLAAQFDDLFARLRVEDNHMDNRFNAALQALEIDTKKTYGYTDDDNDAEKKEDA